MKHIKNIIPKTIDGMQSRDGTELTEPVEIMQSAEWREKVFALDPPVHPEMELATIALERWTKLAARKHESDRRLVLTGKTGIGKSWICRKAMGYLAERAVDLWYRGNWKPNPPRVEIFTWSKLAFIEFKDRNDQSIWVDAVDAEIVYFEDVGTEIDRYKSGEPTEALRMMLEARRNKFTLISTNIASRVWSEKWDDRVADRMYRDSVIVEMPEAPSRSKMFH